MIAIGMGQKLNPAPSTDSIIFFKILDHACLGSEHFFV